MTTKSFFLLCLECPDGQVEIKVDNEKDDFNIDRIKGKCKLCGHEASLRELATRG
jgi:Pyruvate/2-oxoacid:ferredoxin oxidoreductase delta subunit